MKILVSWSTGKDSAWTLHLLRRDGIGAPARGGGETGRPAALLTTVNEAFDRVAMHAVRVEVARAQAEAAGLPLIVVPLPWPCSNAVYEERLGRAVRAAVADRFTHVAFGDLFLRDVRRYREERLAGTGLTPIFPLWARPTDALAREMIDGGLRARITCVDPRVLPASFAGRAFDETLLRDLPPGVDPCGENGEFHTCVTAGPMFAQPIAVETGVVVERDGFVFADIVPSASAALPGSPPSPEHRRS